MLYEVVERPEEDKNSDERYGMQRLWRSKTHTDWVSKVKYIPEMNVVVSASLDRTIAVCDMDTGQEMRRLMGHTKGIFCLDWSQNQKFLATGGMDRTVMIWNPYSNKSMAAMPGHNATICSILVNEAENQVVSLSVDKTVKVWDIRNHRCLQTFIDATKYRWVPRAS